MTGRPPESLAARRILVWSALTLAGALAPISALAAEDFFQMSPLSALPASLFGGEIHIPAARPTVANPAQTRFVAGQAPNDVPEGRLRLRGAAFHGMQSF